IWFLSIFMILAGYLLGSIPTAYIVGRWVKGRDVRQYGSGTVSGSMVYEHIARWAVVPVGLFDVAKAAFPAWLALHWDLGMGVTVAVGIAASVGHNWPVFLNFTGGRGLSTFLGLLLVVFPMGIFWILVPLAIGYLIFKDSPPFALFSMVTLPLFVCFMGGSAILVWGAICMLVITIVKRLEANRRPLTADLKEKQLVLLRRLLLDRDIVSHQDWIDRQPESDVNIKKQ
ncbi:MAG: glycerol-3-phosphate acyltransferase, partial [Anaerolineaceae bacterium]|nr:glycerol-3-phosphate acyltransferase [Anaerolineaceae bacterium]